MSGVFRRTLAVLLAVCLLGCAALAEEYEDYGEYYIEYEDPWEEEQEAITPLRVSLTPENGWVNVGGSGSYRHVQRRDDLRGKHGDVGRRSVRLYRERGACGNV